MKKMKKLFLLVVAVLLLFVSTTNAYALENNGLCEQPNYLSDEISTYGIEKPESEWDLSKEGRYSFSGWCHDHYLYTDYLFTGASKVNIKVKNYSDEKITVKLLEKKTLIDTSASTRTIEAGDTLEWSASSLNSKGYYYLQFSKGSTVSGYIE